MRLEQHHLYLCPFVVQQQFYNIDPCSVKPHNKRGCSEDWIYFGSTTIS